MEQKISVIISTYNNPNWLEKVLWGYIAQTYKNFELIIADDGSTKETFDLIENIKPHLIFPIQHIWHEDNGFQKSQILNKAILAAKTDYLLITDGDCIPRKDFVEIHVKLRQKGRFLSGGYFMLPMKTSLTVSRESILNDSCFNLSWLKKNGLLFSFKNLKLSAKGFMVNLLNRLTTTKPTWNGHNSSGWKEDILKVNGFDERMQYGGQDRELGERLENIGIKGKQIRYSAICVHLDHSRGYATKESWEKNYTIRKHTKAYKSSYTPYGIIKPKTKD